MKRKSVKILIIVVLAAFLIQAGVMAYTAISSNDDSSQQIQTTSLQVNTPQVDTSGIAISDQIQNLIKQADPNNFDRNISNYKLLLVKMDVSQKFRDEIERLIIGRHKLPDILTAYDFLYDSYGLMEDIQKFVEYKESGKNWTQIFADYNRENPKFAPRNFDSDYLQSLMNMSGINTDDIMIADRVSSKLKKPFDEVLDKRKQGTSWKDINTEYNIVNSQSAMPHVPVTEEQIEKYKQNSGMTEDQVVEAFVIAYKLDMNAEGIVNKMKSGANIEQIYADCYQAKYY